MAFITELDITHDWLCYCPECPSVSTPDFSHEEWIREQKAGLMIVIAGQNESSFSNLRWLDCFCVEDDSHHEYFHGTVEQFANKLIELKWAVESVDRFSAMCPTCQNAINEFHFASQYEDERGILG